MTRVDTIVRGDYLLPMDEDVTVIRDGAVAVKDGRILDTGSHEELSRRYEAVRVLGGRGKAVLPGFVNTHTHAPMVFMRGLADDLPLKEWLEENIWPTESRWLSGEFVTDAASLACLEMLKAGITSFCDMYFFEDEVGSVAKSMGMRALLGAGILDFPTKLTMCADDCLENAERLIEKWKGDEFISTSIAPHSAYGCGAETLGKVLDMAERHGVLMQIHLAETRWEVEEIRKNHGKTPVMHLDSVGMLGKGLVAFHCIWVSEEELSLLAEKNVGVSHCVKSNLKLASGIAPVARMLEKGVRVSLGTDGAASNNSIDIMSEMSTAAKLHKAISEDPTVLRAPTALKMATRWGAEVMGMGDVGSLAPGKAADLIVVNLDKPHLSPLYSICSHLVYSARPEDVEDVMVGGKVVVEGGRLVTADEEEILAKAQWWGRKIREDKTENQG
jgi:5-methylthioadenosine/S-adenosylhomocysteine deaminase